jgi:hypothetical protein
MLACLLTVSPALGQETDVTDPAVRVELNAAETTTGACRLSFLIQNEHAAEISSAIYETVLFDAAGAVHQLTLFDFGALPSGRPRVRQFEVQGVGCDGLGSILINGATSCEAGELGAEVCTDTLDLNSRTEIEMLG